MGNSCFGEVSEKRKECGETRERDGEIEQHARISRGAERAFCMLLFTVTVKFNALSFKFQTGKRSCLAYHIRHVAALSQRAV